MCFKMLRNEPDRRQDSNDTEIRGSQLLHSRIEIALRLARPPGEREAPLPFAMRGIGGAWLRPGVGEAI